MMMSASVPLRNQDVRYGLEPEEFAVLPVLGKVVIDKAL